MKLDARKLVNARLDKGWTQEQAADAAKISFSTYNRAESGKDVNPPTALAIAEGLGLSLPDIRHREEDGDAA